MYVGLLLLDYVFGNLRRRERCDNNLYKVGERRSSYQNNKINCQKKVFLLLKMINRHKNETKPEFERAI